MIRRDRRLASSQQHARADKKKNREYSRAANAAMTFTMSLHVLIPQLFAFLAVTSGGFQSDAAIPLRVHGTRARNFTMGEKGEAWPNVATCNLRFLFLRNAGNIHSIGIALLSQNTGIDYTPTSTDRDSVKQLAYLKRRAASNCKGLFLRMVTVPRLRRYHRLKPVVMLQIQSETGSRQVATIGPRQSPLSPIPDAS